jgi:hypothetical protein
MIEPRKRPAETPIEWLRFAEENLQVAEQALSFEKPAWHTICFLCQSAAEKFLKAYLIAKDGSWKEPTTSWCSWVSAQTTTALSPTSQAMARF